ncbi:hypothetical protein Mapa_016803 [Marchantia paleacea]|nr:hypothetical protein Mapa_016803 [Marchantia paleacea]
MDADLALAFHDAIVTSWAHQCSRNAPSLRCLAPSPCNISIPITATAIEQILYLYSFLKTIMKSRMLYLAFSYIVQFFGEHFNKNV